MNYCRIYSSLVNRARFQYRKKRKRTDPNFVYYENHHILPRCLGGSDSENNLVLLTAREHFLAHRLLCKIYVGNRKLEKALIYMCEGRESNSLFLDSYVSPNFISSREYERVYLRVQDYNAQPENAKIFVNNGVQNKMIYRWELEDYLDEGWFRGKTGLRSNSKLFVCKQGIRRAIRPVLKKYYLKAGWTLGNYNESKALKYADFDTSFAWITNGQERHLIGKDALPYALEDGWQNLSRVGKPKGYSRNRVFIQKEDFVKCVNKNVLHLWKQAGWEETYALDKGNLAKSKYKSTCYVSKDNVCYCVTEDVLPYFLKEGWVQGKPKSMYDSRRGKKTVWINNGFVNKRVTPETVDLFLSKNWKKGRFKCLEK